MSQRTQKPSRRRFIVKNRSVDHKRSSTTRIMTPLIALALLGAASGCGSGGSTSANAATGKCTGQTVKVGINNSGSDAPILIAQEKGYFKAAGVKANLVSFKSGGEMIPSLGSGQIDVGAGSPGAGLYNAIGNGLKIKIVADKATMVKNHAYMPLMVKKSLVDSGKVKSVADLKGLTVAQSSEGSTASATLEAILGTAGLHYSDVKTKSLGFPEHVAALKNGSVDASLLVEPFATVAEDQGAAVRFYDPTKVYPNQEVAVILYSAKFADGGSPATCFMKAYLKGARDYYDATKNGKWDGKNAADISSLVAKKIGMDVNLYRRAVPNYVDPNGKVQVDSLTRDYSFFKKQGWIEKGINVDPAKLVDTEFAKAAVKELGSVPTPNQ